MLTQTTDDPLAALISNAGITDTNALKQAIDDAKRLRISLDRALLMSGHVTEKSLGPVRHARQLVLTGELSLNAAISVLRLMHQENLPFEKARERLRELHRRTQQMFTLTNELTSLMLSATVITQEQLGQAVNMGTKSGMLTGRVLRLNRHISTMMLSSCIEGCLMVREETQSKEEVVAGLKKAMEKNVSVSQALFELGTYKQPQNYSLRFADLLVMAGLLAEDDFLECWELTIIKAKSFDQVVREQGLISGAHLETAVHVLGLVSSESLKPYEAAHVLRIVVHERADLYQALAYEKTYNAKQGNEKPLRIGDLLAEANLVSRESVEAIMKTQSSGVKIGKMLLESGLIDESRLFKALRCQSLCRYGYLSRALGVEALANAARTNQALEITFRQMDLHMPSAMQWSWV